MLERVQGQFAEAEPQQAGGPVIVTVHGTNDADLADDGVRWWQRGSEFTQHLIYHLWERGLPDAEILPLHWSGHNSDFDRLKGAEKLAHTLKELDRAGRPHAVIAP